MLSPIADEINNLGSLDHRTVYDIHFVIPKDIQRNGLLYQGYMVQNGLVDMIELNPGNTTLYTPAKTLELYGQPDEVWIRTMNSSPYDDIYFGLALYYSDKGILIFYNYTASLNINKVQGTENVKVCMITTKDNPWLLLWSPEQQRQFPDLAKISFIGPDEAPFYKKLEIVTNMNVEEFYNKFKDSSKTNCLETPANLWPPPS